MARDKKTATGRSKKPEDDAMVDDAEGADSDDPKDSDDYDLPPSDDDDDGEENIPLRAPARQAKVPRKQTAATIPARSTKAEDRSECTAWYVTFLGVKVETAEYLHDMEHLTKPFHWIRLNEKTISMIVKGCRDANIHVSVSASNKMALLAFLCMHHDRIQRPLLDMTSIDEDMLDDIERQKKLEDQYKDDKPTSDPLSLPLDDANVTKSISTFEEDLARRRGIMGHPLKYVIRHKADVPAAHLDPPFGDPETSYVSMDDEMIGRAQIYSREVDCDEDVGPWSKVFVIDSATVYTLMEKAFGKSAYWTNARIYSRKKEGRKAWRGLIKYHFGNDRSVTMAETLRTKLQNTTFGGPKRNFSFDKYCNVHTSTYSTAADILTYQDDKTPIFSETTKIQLFQNGITDPYFSTIKGIVNAERYKYPTFEGVKLAYVNYTRTSPRPEIAHGNSDSRNVSQTTTSRNSRSNQTKTKGGVKPTQEEIDACTHIKGIKYSKAEYDKFTAAEKARHYQLKVKNGQKRGVAEIGSSEQNVEHALGGGNAGHPALVRQDKIPKIEKDK